MAELQFDTAEYVGTAPSCGFCKRRIAGPRYLLGPRVVCPECREILVAHTRPATGAVLARGVLYGVGAAVGAAVGWYAVSVTVGRIGLLAIAVGWAVGTAIREGSGGGRTQQWVAVALTYLAIVATFIPDLWVHGPVDAVLGALTTPVRLAVGGDGSALLWVVMIGFALWYAWQRTAGLRLEFTGPFADPVVP